jgi:hypothetical protein
VLTAYERAIAQARRALLKVEGRAASAITSAYQPVINGLRNNLAALTVLLKAAGYPVDSGWLDRQDRYRRLLTELETDLAAFAGASAVEIEGTQRRALELGGEHAPVLTLAALGPGPTGGRDTVHGMFEPPSPALATDVVGRAGNGVPLGLLLLDVAQEEAQQTRDTLRAVAASGAPQGFDATRLVEQATETPLARALTLHRTETLGAYRRATAVAYQQSSVVEGWRWYATPGSERTCIVCLAMHGTLHPVTEPFASHPACRCVALPIVASWADLGFPGVPDHRPTLETGEEAFARLTRQEKLHVVGAAKLALLDAGRITLMDLVRPTYSKRWGPGLREASLTELGVAA